MWPHVSIFGLVNGPKQIMHCSKSSRHPPSSDGFLAMTVDQSRKREFSHDNLHNQKDKIKRMFLCYVV